MANQIPTQPKLTDLLAHYLTRRGQAQELGLADAGAGAEVTPYEAGPVQPIDAKVAWEQALAVVPYFQPAVDASTWSAPPHWESLVAAHEPAVAIAFCLGNFPQLVRSFHGVLQQNAGPPADAGHPVAVPALADWARQAAAQKDSPRLLLALGTWRLAKNFEQAGAFAKANDGLIAPQWRAVWENEKAALAWHEGRAEAARALWTAMPPSVPVQFNRGMAELFLGNTATGSALLNEVLTTIPETSAWHHLARLYVLLAGLKT